MNSVEKLREAGWQPAILEFATALDADGYDLHLERRDDGRLDGSVVARPEACADCLVPKDVLGMVLSDACGVPLAQIDLRYPHDESA